MGRINGLRGVADEVRQYPLDDGRILDARRSAWAHP
jgi:hypothetical protein